MLLVRFCTRNMIDKHSLYYVCCQGLMLLLSYGYYGNLGFFFNQPRTILVIVKDIRCVSLSY